MACRSLYLTHTPTSPKYSINYEHNQLKMCGLTFMTCDGCSKHINTIFQSAVALCMLMLCKHTTTHHWVARLRPDNTSWLTDPLLPVAFCCAPTSQWTGSSAPPLRSRTSRCSGLSSALHRPTVCLNRRTSNKDNRNASLLRWSGMENGFRQQRLRTELAIETDICRKGAAQCSIQASKLGVNVQ